MSGYWKLDDEMILQDVINNVRLQLRVHETIKRTKIRKRGNARQMLYRQRKRNSADEIIQVKTRSKSKSRTRLLMVLAGLIKIFIFLRKRDWILYGERKKVNNKQTLWMSLKILYLILMKMHDLRKVKVARLARTEKQDLA